MPAKRSYRKKRTVRKKAFRSKRRITYVSPKIMNIKRTYVRNLTVTGSSSTVQSGQIIPDLFQLPSYSEITELFAQYRFCKIKIKWQPTYNMLDGISGSSVATSGANGLFYATCQNRSGVVAEFDTENEFLESADGQYARPLTTPRKWYYTPNTLGESYRSTTATAYTPQYKKWFVTSDPIVPQYGFSYYVLPFGIASADLPSTGFTLGRFYITCYLQAKGIK